MNIAVPVIYPFDEQIILVCRNKCKTWKMPFRRISYFLIATIVFQVLAINIKAQCVAWLKGRWDRPDYIIGSNPPQKYDLLLTISSIKGKDFEGVMRTIQPSDPEVHFDTKVSGTIFDDYLQIHIGTWKVSCGTCKPQ